MSATVHGARRSGGFTLLELIVVVAIFAIFAVLAYGGLDSVLKTRHSVEAAQMRLAELQRAYLRLRDDFQQVSLRGARDNYGDLQAAFSGVDNGGIELSRGGWRNPMGLPRPTLQRIAYKLSDDALHRLSWPMMDRAQDTEPLDRVLLQQVTDLQWRFLDENREWQNRWPPLNSTGSAAEAAVAAPPVAVEMKLKTKDLGDLRFVFRLGLDAIKLSDLPSGTTGTQTQTDDSRQDDTNNAEANSDNSGGGEANDDNEANEQ